MKQMEKMVEAANFTAANVGKLNELGDYVLALGPDVKIPGKVFGGTMVERPEASFRSSLSCRARKPASCIHIKSTKNCISF